MQHYDHLIVGGGMVADSAANGLREQGATGTIGILSEEPTRPFPRPALSKKLWTDPDFTVENTALRTSESTGATIHLETRATGVDPASRTVTTAGGEVYGFENLLIATGGHPRQIDGLLPGERVLYFRTLSDYHRLRAAADAEPHVAVVGAGYIGAEIAAALIQQGCRVSVLHPGEVMGDLMFPREIAERLESALTDAGVEVSGGTTVTGGHTDGDGVVLDLDTADAAGPTSLRADLVVLGLGVDPATDFLRGTLELAEDGGVVVDEHLCTSAPHVWAAGDVASYPDVVLGRTRVEHVDNATTMGAAVGRIIGGSDEVYDHTPYFYSDVLDLGYEGMGSLDASLETFVEEVDEQEGSAVVYYLDDDAVRGVLTWNMFGALDAARDLLARAERPDAAHELAGTVRAPS